MMEEGRQVFAQVVQRVSRLTYFYQILEDQETRLQLKAFRLEKLLPERALQTYNRIFAKHQNPSEFNPKPDAWYESEKRLFAWFMALYTYLQMNSKGIKTQLDFTLLSKVFFLKNADFLEFHWLVLVKSVERAEWEEQQEAMLLEAIKEHGMKWNEVSRSIFMKTNKTIFRSPKVCRERWLNHLDQSKIRGNWTTREDAAIFEYVVETSSKRWSKLVAVLGERRTEHTIKNRFNAMIAKHRRYKCEKDLKVAARILQDLRKKLEEEGSANAEEIEEGEEQSESKCKGEKKEHISPQEEDAMHIGAEVEAEVQQKFEQRHEAEEGIKEEANAEAQVVRQSAVGDEVVFPFENYSYQMDMYNQIYAFQQNQMLYYHQLLTLAPLPTADTTSRHTKILEQRRRKKETKKEE